MTPLNRNLLRLAILITCLVGPTSAYCDEPNGELAKKLSAVKFERYADAPGYSEGPIWRDGEVFFCSGGLLRVDRDRKVSTYLEIGPAGAILRGNGHILICDNKHHALLDLAPDGKVFVVAEQFEGRPLRSLNDVTIDARGNVYWSDPGDSSPKNLVGQIFRVRPDGRVERVASGLAFPNGLDVDPSGKHLYVIESQTQKILRYDIPADDAPFGKPSVFYELGGSGGDGCEFDAAGNLWVADFHRPETKSGRITVLSPEAKVLAYLPLPSKVVSNITFGGPGHDEIFCTTGDPPGVFHAKVGVKGFAGHPAKELRMIRPLDVVPMHPHGDADLLANIARLALAAWSGGDPLEIAANRDAVLALIRTATDPTVRRHLETFMPLWDAAAKRHQANRPLLAEIKRLGGTAKLEIAAPDWLRAIVGDSKLAAFSKIVEIDVNERTDGHAAPEKKKPADRVTDDWLKRVVGQDALRRLELSGTAVTSAGLAHLAGLTNLETLNVCLTAVDDEGLKHLAALTKMRRMVVCSSKITGSGFQHLQSMNNIESINLHFTASDAGLEAIGKLTHLRRLEIVHTKVTDAGLAHLAGLANLRQLHVASHDTTEAGLAFVDQLKNLEQLDVYERPASNQTLARIAKLPKLRILMLNGGTFDDDGVKALVGMTTLEDVSLSSAKVTDASIDHLASLRNLRKLTISGTHITPAGRARLTTILPNVEIQP